MTQRPDGLDNDGNSPPPYTAAPNHKNIVLFGETGAGKSAVVNLIADAKVASISPDTKACTLQATKYSLTLPATGQPPGPVMPINIWDTIGLEEPDGDVFKGIENAHTLIQDLHAAGGVDLLLFCIRAGRVTVAMQRHYRLFFEILCAKRVPVAIVVTHLENEKVMGEWWVRNRLVLEAYGMCSVAHACITAAPVHLQQYASKRVKSQWVVQDMLRRTLSEPRPPYVEDIRSWFASVIEMIWAFLTSGVGGSLKKKVLVRQLEARCSFRREDAQKLAKMILTPRSV